VTRPDGSELALDCDRDFVDPHAMNAMQDTVTIARGESRRT
jgi:hypothetical protein